MRKIAIGFIVGTLAATVFGGAVGVGITAASAEEDRPRVPRCAEDEMVDGRGDFENGRWSRYVCVHPEDVAAGEIEHHYNDPTIYATVRGSVCEHGRFWRREVGIEPAAEETCN